MDEKTICASEVLHDKDIREPLFDFLEETYGKVRIIEGPLLQLVL